MCYIRNLYLTASGEGGILKYKVKTQNLVNNSIDGSICVRTEQVYNKMSKAMFNFTTALFKPTHKSYYNEIDV